MNFNWLEIFIAIGGTSGLTTLLTLQIQRRKGKAEAGQEEGKEKQEHLNAQKITDEVYALMSERLKDQYKEMNNEIKDLKDTQKDLLKTIEIQDGNIKHLQRTVDEYKQTCDDCQFRIAKKTTNGKSKV